MDLVALVSLLVVVALGQHIFYRRVGLRGVGYSRSFAEQAVWCGDEVEYVESIANAKWLPIPWVSVESMMPLGLRFHTVGEVETMAGQAYAYHKSVLAMPAYTAVTRRYRLTCMKRGHYRITAATVSCGDLFSLRPRSVSVTSPSELIVYPALVDLHDIPIESHSWQGDISVRRFILDDPFTHAGTRDHAPGDPLNQIHWKASARVGRLQVIRRDFTADYHLMILLNFAVSPDMWEAVTDATCIERGICYAATIAQEAIARGVPTGFGCNGRQPARERTLVRIDPSASAAHLHDVLATLAGLELVCTASFASTLERELERHPHNVDYLLLTAYRDEALNANAQALQMLGNAVAWLPLETST